MAHFNIAVHIKLKIRLVKLMNRNTLVGKEIEELSMKNCKIPFVSM